MDVKYRAPGPEDAAALAELSRTTFVDTFGHLYDADNLSSFLESSYSIEATATDIANPRRIIRVAVEDGVMVGYCKLSLDVSFKDAPPDWQNGIELKQLYMRASQFGKGTAVALLNWAISEAHIRGAPDIILSVWSENYRAQRFYQRSGFAYICDTYFMVGDHRDDEYLYGLRLDKGAPA
jgi:diamine N-acetyltransferase